MRMWGMIRLIKVIQLVCARCVLWLGVGAAVGVAAMIVHDIAVGEVSSIQFYAGAAVGCAITGLALSVALATMVGAIASGGAEGLAQNVTTQGLDIASGNQEDFSVGKAAASTALGAAAGPAGNVLNSAVVKPSLGALIARFEASQGADLARSGMASAVDSVANPGVTTAAIKLTDTVFWGGRSKYSGRSLS